MAMKKRSIGSLLVSEVGVGCNNFGMRLDFDGTKAVVDSAIENGINFFDTADIYGGTKSEVLLGQALGGRRAEVIIASKFGMPIDETRFGAKPQYVRSACEDSLKRLGTDYIDLYQLHYPDPTVPIADTIGAMQELVAEGKVREIGCSNFTADQLREAKVAAGNGPSFVSVQNQYSLLERAPERDGVLDACAELGIGFLPFYPLANGWLTGKIHPGAPLPEGTRLKAMQDTNPERSAHWLSQTLEAKAGALLNYADEAEISILDLAFSWLLSHPQVSSVIAGASNPGQVHSNSTSVHTLSAEIISTLNLLSA